jgi:hypothetical protein
MITLQVNVGHGQKHSHTLELFFLSGFVFPQTDYLELVIEMSVILK